eukprot:CAMPEP_0175279694 /NCGR_PEP_ID=MMETSP0093-20121207/50176_1 /TAXON_ID=311494 /ORGANISM="Alexandrium monilatum, Strain CCMP3105" /LENGTH=71 /DNA_ID=CAMNT_0016574729 /DNA_START=75 /DNA_END=288 /DNA_ORIENTATION=+
MSRRGRRKLFADMSLSSWHLERGRPVSLAPSSITALPSHAREKAGLRGSFCKAFPQMQMTARHRRGAAERE